MMKFTESKIIDYINNKNIIRRTIVLIIGAFIAAFMYNAFIVPNNIVYGGLGGVAIIANKMFGIATTEFINIVTVILIIISILLIGFKHTSYTIIGFTFYTLMINFTSPLASKISFVFDSYLFSIILGALITGFGFGLIYRAGFNTGGADTVVAILQYYLHLPTAKISTIINTIIIIFGAAIFGIVNSMYALIFLKVMNFVSDAIILGLSDSKLCYIRSNKTKEIEEYLRKELDVGYTLIESTNGVGFFKRYVILVVLPTTLLDDLKHSLRKIDKRAMLISNDCYTVENGYTNRLIKV